MTPQTTKTSAGASKARLSFDVLYTSSKNFQSREKNLYQICTSCFKHQEKLIKLFCYEQNPGIAYLRMCLFN